MQRFFISVLLLVDPALSAAQSYLGTKAGGGTPAVGSDVGPGAGSFLQMLAALAVVLILLKFVAPKLLGRAKKRLVTDSSGNLRVEETAHFAGGALYIVRARSKTLLLGVNGASISCLADLTETAVAAVEEPTFQEIIERTDSGPIDISAFQPEFASKTGAGNPTAAEVEEALRRLQRLAN
jgi:flagellar biogenesis protein FliO